MAVLSKGHFGFFDGDCAMLTSIGFFGFACGIIFLGFSLIKVMRASSVYYKSFSERYPEVWEAIKLREGNFRGYQERVRLELLRETLSASDDDLTALRASFIFWRNAFLVVVIGTSLVAFLAFK